MPILKREFFNLWLTLMLVWTIANASLRPEVLGLGALVAAVLAWAFAAFGQTWRFIRWTPKVIVYYLLYLGVFLSELVKANLAVAWLAVSPRLNIQPGIVEIRTRLKTPLGRLALANSITLTPGTLVVDIRGDALFVHMVQVRGGDVEASTREIAGRFEKYLEVIFG